MLTYGNIESIYRFYCLEDNIFLKALIFILIIFNNFLFNSLNAQELNKGKMAYALLEFDSNQEMTLFSSYVQENTPNLTSLYLASDNENYFEISDEVVDWQNFVKKLGKKQNGKDTEKFLKYAFYKTHRKFLKHYNQYSSLQTTFAKGNYDCLSGTALYVLLLEELGYTYEIKETDYHIYILVTAKVGDNGNYYPFLFESTDPLSGFVSDEKDILKRRDYYLNPALVDEGMKGISDKNWEYQFSRSVDNSINKIELAGLQYYNIGIAQYNRYEFKEAIKSLQKALFFYDSPRIKEFLNLTVSVALESDELREADKLAIEVNYLKWLRIYPNRQLFINSK